MFSASEADLGRALTRAELKTTVSKTDTSLGFVWSRMNEKRSLYPQEYIEAFTHRNTLVRRDTVSDFDQYRKTDRADCHRCRR